METLRRVVVARCNRGCAVVVVPNEFTEKKAKVEMKRIPIRTGVMRAKKFLFLNFIPEAK
jgi:hypothetical protein